MTTLMWSRGSMTSSGRALQRERELWTIVGALEERVDCINGEQLANEVAELLTRTIFMLRFVSENEWQHLEKCPAHSNARYACDCGGTCFESVRTVLGGGTATYVGKRARDLKRLEEMLANAEEGCSTQFRLKQEAEAREFALKEAMWALSKRIDGEEYGKLSIKLHKLMADHSKLLRFVQAHPYAHEHWCAAATCAGAACSCGCPEDMRLEALRDEDCEPRCTCREPGDEMPFHDRSCPYGPDRAV
jgi:hypothetical protein